MAYKKQKNVNIDALIAREDFEAADETTNTASKISTLSVNDLKEGSGLFLASVRKPDFQRETADWDIDKIVRFIKSFVDGEFIPAVILWRSQAGLIFVIDGSHRLSSLIAWVNDDYGDGQFSLEAFDGEIPDEQRQIARKARETINSQIGPYSDYYKDDLTGEATIRSLKRTERMVQLFSSVAPCSYGLHPLLYCYSNKGNFRPASFYGAIEFIRTLDTNPAILKSFIEQRKNFEDFIFENDIAVQRIIDTYRRGLQSARHISDYYVCVLNLFASGKTSVEVQESILANPKYQRLKLTFSPELEVTTGAFNSGNKSEVYIQEAYKKAPRCAICGGLLHTHSISIDHIQRKRDGGLGCVENGQLTHPYCNTGVKN